MTINNSGLQIFNTTFWGEIINKNMSKKLLPHLPQVWPLTTTAEPTNNERNTTGIKPIMIINGNWTRGEIEQRFKSLQLNLWLTHYKNMKKCFFILLLFSASWIDCTSSLKNILNWHCDRSNKCQRCKKKKLVLVSKLLMCIIIMLALSRTTSGKKKL